MQIKILDGYVENPEKLNWTPLTELGELSVCDRAPMEDAGKIAQVIGDAEIIVINKVLIGREVLDACPNLRYIAVASTGYNQVDVDYAREKMFWFLMCRATERMPWRSLQLPCCWNCADVCLPIIRWCTMESGGRIWSIGFGNAH